MKKEPLLEQFTAFGISSTEAKIYLHLVNKTPRSILQIAQDLNLPRTSIYDNVVKLAEKGLVQKIVKHKSQQIQAYPLDILQEYVDKERERVKDLQKRLANLERHTSQAGAQTSKTEVRYYHGVQGAKQMISNTLKAQGETVGYSRFGLTDIVGKAFYKKKMYEFIQLGLKDRVIVNSLSETIERLADQPHAEDRRLYQDVRVMPASRLEVSGNVTIYNNVFATTHWEQDEVVGVEIENAELAKTQKSIFEQLWALAEPFDDFIERTKKS